MPRPIRLGLTATPPAPGSAGAERLRELIGPLVFQLEIADLAGRDLAALDIVHLPVALTPAERVAYERDIEAFTRLRRELRRANPDADWVTCLRAIACMPDGAEVLTTMRRAAALAAYPDAKRRSTSPRKRSLGGRRAVTRSGDRRSSQCFSTSSTRSVMVNPSRSPRATR